MYDGFDKDVFVSVFIIFNFLMLFCDMFLEKGWSKWNVSFYYLDYKFLKRIIFYKLGF